MIIANHRPSLEFNMIKNKCRSCFTEENDFAHDHLAITRPLHISCDRGRRLFAASISFRSRFRACMMAASTRGGDSCTDSTEAGLCFVWGWKVKQSPSNKLSSCLTRSIMSSSTRYVERCRFSQQYCRICSKYTACFAGTRRWAPSASTYKTYTNITNEAYNEETA